jgi:thiol-disulfide isomerase/thioredoxin
MMPLINALEREGYPIAKINVFENTDFGIKYKIEAVPTFLILKNGTEIKRLIGSQTKVALLAALDTQEN